MIKGIVKSSFYWGFNKGNVIYIDLSGKFHHKAIGIYDSNKKFSVYVWGKDELNECVEMCS